MKRTILFLFSSLLFISCAAPAQTVSPQAITAYASPSAQPWMSELFGCANEHSIVVEVTAENPSVLLRVASLELAGLMINGSENVADTSEGTPSAYPIGEEEIVIAVRRDSPIQNLTLEEAQAVFAGLGDESVRVWVYASGEDLQGVFDQFVMQRRSVTSFARMASSPQEMSEALHSQADAIGFLPKRWVTENLRIVYSLGNFPVLAVTRGAPRGAARTIVGCLQSK